MSFSRLTWRNVLCMGEHGPGEDLEAQVLTPLNHSQMANVLATAEGMTDREKLLFLSSLVRFVLEICHQVSVSLAADCMQPPNAMPDVEDFGLVQTSVTLLDKTQILIRRLQAELEEGTHAVLRARHLKEALQHEWGQELSGTTSDEVQSLMALLVVYSQEDLADDVGMTDPSDSEWVASWTWQLRGFLEELLHAPDASATTPGPVWVDGPTATPSPTARPAALQREEDAALALEMERPVKRQHRLQVNVTVSTNSSSSTSRIHLPCPRPGGSIAVSLRLQGVEAMIRDEPDAGVSLMQTSTSTGRSILDALTGPVRRRLALRLAQLLQDRTHHLLRECHMILREQRDFQNIFMNLEGPMEGDDPAQRDRTEDCVELLAHCYLQDFQNQVDQLLTPPNDSAECESTNDEIITQLMEMMGRPLDVSGPRIRRPLSTRPTQVGTEQQALRIANEILDQTQSLLYSHEGTSRAHLLRDFTAELVRGVQNLAARLLTTLHLVAHHLPQPYAVAGPTSYARALGRGYARDVLNEIAERFDNDAGHLLGNGSYGIDEVSPLLPALCPMAMQAMSLLEDASYLLDDISQDDHGENRSPVLLPPHAPRVEPNVQHGGSTSSVSARPGNTTTPTSTPTSTATCTPTATVDSDTNLDATRGRPTPASNPNSPTTSLTTEPSRASHAEGSRSHERGSKAEGKPSPKKRRQQPVDDTKGIKKFMSHN